LAPLHDFKKLEQRDGWFSGNILFRRSNSLSGKDIKIQEMMRESDFTSIDARGLAGMEASLRG